MARKEVKSRIGSVKNIQKITRAMEMVAAARLRRAEQRIEALRPYASAIRRMTRQAAEAAQNVPNLPILAEHEAENTVGLLLETDDRGLAGAFNSQIVRAGVRVAAEHEETGHTALVEYEPDPEDILQRLVPAYVEISLFRALLESAASEHGARMTAMRNASQNAGDIIDSLTLDMNRARQSEITQEILEVVAGADALTA